MPLLPEIASQLGLPRSFVTGNIGRIDPAKAVAAEEAYVSAFFDRWLRGQDRPRGSRVRPLPCHRLHPVTSPASTAGADTGPVRRGPASDPR